VQGGIIGIWPTVDQQSLPYCITECVLLKIIVIYYPWLFVLSDEKAPEYVVQMFRSQPRSGDPHWPRWLLWRIW